MRDSTVGPHCLPRENVVVRIRDPKEAETLALAMRLAKQEARFALGKRKGVLVSDREAIAVQRSLWESRPQSQRSVVTSAPITSTPPAPKASPRVRTFAPSPAPSSIVSIERDLHDNPFDSRSHSTASTSRSSFDNVLSPDEVRAHKLATTYLNVCLGKSGKFVMSVVGYFVARVLNRPLNVWSRDEHDDCRLTDRYVPAGAENRPPVDVLFNGVDHFDSWGDNPPVAQNHKSVPAPTGRHTPADGNCFFHAAAEQAPLIHYETDDIDDVRELIVRGLRHDTTVEAARQLNDAVEGPAALEKLAIAGSMEIDALLGELESLSLIIDTFSDPHGQTAATFWDDFNDAHDALTPWLQENTLNATQHARYLNIPHLFDRPRVSTYDDR